MRMGLSWARTERNDFFLNVGDGRFIDVGASSGADRFDDSRSVATTDWDGDGRLDMLVKNRTAPRLRFFHNRDESGHHWLEISLQAVSTARDAIGARVVVELEDRSLRKTLYAGDGYLSQSSTRLHFGLGDSTRVKRLQVRWPGGGSDAFEGLAADTHYRLTEGAKAAEAVARVVHPLVDLADDPWVLPPVKVRRIVVTEGLPLAPLGLPAFENPARRVADVAGKPTLIILWSTESSSSEAQLLELSRRRASLEESGLQVIPQVVDGVRDHARAKERLQELGFTTGTGWMGSQRQQDLQMILIHVRGNHYDLELPVSLLLDAEGRLMVIYSARMDWEQIEGDVKQIQALPATGSRPPSTETLMGGTWLQHPKHDYQSLVSGFSRTGRTDLAAYYARLAQR
jgi:hypothetical protein